MGADQKRSALRQREHDNAVLNYLAVLDLELGRIRDELVKCRMAVLGEKDPQVVAVVDAARDSVRRVETMAADSAVRSGLLLLVQPLTEALADLDG